MAADSTDIRLDGASTGIAVAPPGLATIAPPATEDPVANKNASTLGVIDVNTGLLAQMAMGGGDGSRTNPFYSEVGACINKNGGVLPASSQLLGAKSGRTIVPVAADPDGSVITTPTGILSGQAILTAPGSRPLVTASTACKGVTVKALRGNTDTIYVGNSTVSTSCFPLDAGESVSFDIDDLSKVYIYAGLTGDGVAFLGVA